jgi:hypothetical protein
MATDPLDPTLLRKQNRQQLLSDILRNARGVPEAALTMGTGLADMAGTGLGTLAGMARSKLKGEPVDMDAAAEGMQAGKFTYAPRTEGGQEFARGLGTVMEPIEKGMQYAGQKAADVTGSPAVGAGVYTALNVLDPELLAPAAAKVAALRGASNVARGAAETAVPMGEALRNVPRGQRGAYTLEDLSAVEGDFEFQSPTLRAFDKLKPQEQGRVSGKQLGKALMRELGKKEELSWMGLDDIINSDEMVNVADVRKIAEANAPEFDYASARAGGAGTELDEDAISEAARERAYEDDDLNYPVAVYRGTGRHREHVETYDTQREADRAIRELRESYVDDNLESETEYQLTENLENAFSEEELAEMTDAQKQEWAENEARTSLEENAGDVDYETENDYDSGATNIDEITEYWENEIRSNPGDYGIEGTSGSAPAYGQYTVGKKGQDSDYNYTVSAGRLKGEERFGKGRPVGEEPEFLKPYMHAAEQPELLESPDQMALFPQSQQGTTPSRAFQIEALRRKAREADPNIEQFRGEVDKSHYDELGSDQMYFTRETDRPAPEWGSVQSGIGRVPGSKLKQPGGEELPQREGNSYPMRLVDETQSDWLQKGRKTGWADPKGLEKIAREDAGEMASVADEKARVEGFQQQAMDELPTALEDDRIASFITSMREQVAQASQLGTEAPYYAAQIEDNLRRFIERNQRNPNAFSLDERQQSAHDLFRGIYNASDSGSPTEAFADQITRSLQQLPQMTESPVRNTPTPSSPMRETRQYTQLSMADALRRAVQEGQQYLAWTPGDVHTKRWGTDTFQYTPSPDNPRLIRYSGYDTSTEKNTGRTGLENLQATADELLDKADADTLDLDAPDIDEKLFNIVKSQLDYGMHEHRKPDLQRKKRAAALKKDLEAASKAAQAGERKAAHYSPRAVGYDLAYEPTADDIISVLRRAGVQKLPEIRDIPNPDSPKPLRGFEIDPEVAQAAKRGLTLPY